MGLAKRRDAPRSRCRRAQAYLKMDNVIIDDRRIKVDFSQSVSKTWNRYRRKEKMTAANVDAEAGTQRRPPRAVGAPGGGPIMLGGARRPPGPAGPPQPVPPPVALPQPTHEPPRSEVPRNRAEDDSSDAHKKKHKKHHKKHKHRDGDEDRRHHKKKKHSHH